MQYDDDHEHEHEAKRVIEWPVFTEKHWYAASLSLVIVGLVLAVFASAWVFSAASLQEAKLKTELVTPFATIFLATVTFCTVAWRGMVNSRQADQQQRQNDAKDEENTARLLLDGTKLLGEAEESHVLAGIAALQSVVASPGGKFAAHAMDILADLAEATYADTSRGKVFEACRNALKVGAINGRRASRTLDIDVSNGERQLPYIDGLAGMRVTGASVSRLTYKRFMALRRVQFIDSTITHARVGEEGKRHKGCTFNRCRVVWFSRFTVASNSYVNCDFSGAEFWSTRQTPNYLAPLKGLANKGNYYSELNPVKDSIEFDWDMYLLRETGVEGEAEDTF